MTSWSDAAWLYLGAFFDLFKDKSTALVLGGAILGGLALAFASFRGWAVGRPAAEIRRVLAHLEAIPDERSFAADFERLDEDVRSSTLLKHAWQEFSETLIRPEDDREPVRMAVRPEEYFSRETLGLKFPIWHALPNYFVGVGLLCTFCGLVAALHFASGAVSGNVTTAQGALADLLTAATFKFLTSICGLLASIVFSLVYHRGVKHLENLLEKLNRALEHRTLQAAPEGIADRQLRQLERQTLQLERFNSDVGMQIAEGIASRLDGVIADGLRRAIEPLAGAVQELAQGMGSQNLDALRGMVASFHDQLRAGSGAEMERVAATLQTLHHGLEKMSGNLDAQSRSFSDQFELAATKLERAADLMLTSLGRGMDQAVVALRSAIGEMTAGMAAETNAASRSLRDTMQASGAEMGQQLTASASALTARLDEAAGGLNGGTRALGEHLERTARRLEQAGDVVVRQLGQAVATAAEGLSTGLAATASQAAAQAGDSGRLLHEAMRSGADEVRQGLATATAIFTGRLEEAARELGGTMRPLSERLAAFTHALAGLDQRLERQVEAFDLVGRRAHDAASALGEAGQNLLAASAPVAGTAVALGTATSRMAEMMQGFDATRGVVEQLGGQLTMVGRTLEHAWSSYAGRFDEVDERLENIFREFLNGTQTYQEGIKTFVTALNDDLSNAVKTLGGGTEQLESIVSDLVDVMGSSRHRQAAE